MTEEHRKIRQDLFTKEETMITEAMSAIEDLGADVLLTSCVVLLTDARGKLQDWLEYEGKL